MDDPDPTAPEIASEGAQDGNGRRVVKAFEGKMDEGDTGLSDLVVEDPPGREDADVGDNPHFGGEPG